MYWWAKARNWDIEDHSLIVPLRVDDFVYDKLTSPGGLAFKIDRIVMTVRPDGTFDMGVFPSALKQPSIEDKYVQNVLFSAFDLLSEIDTTDDEVPEGIQEKAADLHRIIQEQTQNDS